jgi:hypothetical protein
MRCHGSGRIVTPIPNLDLIPGPRQVRDILHFDRRLDNDARSRAKTDVRRR